MSLTLRQIEKLSTMDDNGYTTPHYCLKLFIRDSGMRIVRWPPYLW